MLSFLLLQIFVLGLGMLLGLVIASGVDRVLGHHGVVALASLTLAMTAVLNMG